MTCAMGQPTSLGQALSESQRVVMRGGSWRTGIASALSVARNAAQASTATDDLKDFGVWQE